MQRKERIKVLRYCAKRVDIVTPRWKKGGVRKMAKGIGKEYKYYVIRTDV